MKKIKNKIYKKIMIFSLIPMLSTLNSNKTDNNDKIINFKSIVSEDKTNNIEYEFLDSNSELKKYFSGDITFDILKQSLESNNNITDEYKEYTNEFIDLVEQKFPNVDLTIFNENIKIFSVKEISEAEMKKEKNRDACYNIPNITILMHNEHSSIDKKKYCYFHELWHMFNNLCLEIDGTIYYKTPTLYELDGTAFDEGINTFLTEQIINCGLQSYVRQYDQIRILYEIFGDELLYIYLDTGIEGVEIYLSKYIGYGETVKLIEGMNNELLDKTIDPLPIFDTITNLYIKSGNKSIIKTTQITNILQNLIYDKTVKEQIILNFENIIGAMEVPDNALVSFDDKSFYRISDLYFVECDNNKYIVNDEIVINYFNSGFIKNIFEENEIYCGNEIIRIGLTLQEYIKYNEEFYNYDKDNNIVYIDEKIVKDESYVKSK